MSWTRLYNNGYSGQQVISLGTPINLVYAVGSGAGFTAYNGFPMPMTSTEVTFVVPGVTPSVTVTVTRTQSAGLRGTPSLSATKSVSPSPSPSPPVAFAHSATLLMNSAQLPAGSNLFSSGYGVATVDLTLDEASVQISLLLFGATKVAGATAAMYYSATLGAVGTVILPLPAISNGRIGSQFISFPSGWLEALKQGLVYIAVSTPSFPSGMYAMCVCVCVCVCMHGPGHATILIGCAQVRFVAKWPSRTQLAWPR
jgi:hypothetical protein